MPSANTVAELAVVVTADTSKAESSLNTFSNSIAAGVGAATGLKIFDAAFSGITTAIEGSVVAAADFEKTMSAVKAVSGASATEMDALSAKALQLGKDTSFSASEAGKGIEELVKGGLTIPDIMNGAAEATLNLAAAGGVSLPDAATIAANALAQFNLHGEDMAHVADLIAGAANASALDVSDFKFSLTAAGAVAATVGFSFDDLAQAIAVMGKAGITGSDAGTSLKTMMMRLSPSTNKASDEMRALGIIGFDTANAMEVFRSRGLDPARGSMEDAEEQLKQLLTGWDGTKKMTKEQEDAWISASSQLHLYNNAFFDATGKVKSFADVSEVLKNATGDLTNEQKLNSLQTIFGSDAIRAAAVAAKEGAAGVNEMAASMGKVSAESVGLAKLDNLSGSFEQMKGSAETLGITIGQALLPLLRDLVDDATNVINALIPIATQVGPEVTAALSTVATDVRTAFGGVIDWFVQNAPLISQTWHTVVGGVATDNASLKSDVSTTWDDIRASTGTGLANLGDAIKLAMHVINGDWSLAWKDLTAIGEREQAAQLAAGQKHGEQMLAVIDTLTGGALTKTGDWWTAMTTAFTTGWQAAVDATTTGVAAVLAPITETYATIQTATETVFRAVANILTAIWQEISAQIIQPQLDAITTAVQTAWDAIKTATTTVLSSVLAYIRDTIFTPIQTAVETSINAARDAVAAAWDAISAAAHRVLDPILSYITDTIFGAMQTKVETSSTGISGAFTGAITTIKSTVDGALQSVKDVWESTWTAIRTAAESPKAAMDVLIKLVGDLKTAMPEWLIPHSPTPFQVGLEGIMKAAKDANSKVSGFLAGSGKVPGALDDWLRAAMDVSGVGDDWLEGLRWLAMHESTGNPTAVNPFDVNNVLNGPGPHAMGLMQTIPSTFAAYRNKDLPNDILDPVANATASIAYILKRYGSIGNVISGWASRGGYAAGGWAGLHGPELAWLGERGPEYVVPHSALGSGSGAHSTMTINVAIGGRVAEQIVVEGYDLAVRRGRLPASGLRLAGGVRP